MISSDSLKRRIERKLRNGELKKMAKVASAPERLTGDSIELTPLKGKMVGVLVRSRDSKNTRFGVRSMSHVLIATEGAKGPDDVLEGIMFQTYFQDLRLDMWYVGIVDKVPAGNRNEAWVLKTDKLDKKKAGEFAKLLSSIDTQPSTEQYL